MIGLYRLAIIGAGIAMALRAERASRLVAEGPIDLLDARHDAVHLPQSTGRAPRCGNATKVRR